MHDMYHDAMACIIWYSRWDSNPYDLRRRILSPLRLPIPPRERSCDDMSHDDMTTIA